MQLAGTSCSARWRLMVGDIRWADVILVIEQEHKSHTIADFRNEVRYKLLHVLDIPDDYKYMDPELVELLRGRSVPYILAEPEHN